VLLATVALPTTARAQVCGAIEMEKAQKREVSKQRKKKEEGEPPRQLAPRRYDDPRKEIAEAVRAFEREAREFQRDVGRAVIAAYRRKKAMFEKIYDTRIREQEGEEREWRDKAIVALEQFIERFPDDPTHTPVRMGQLGELYFERSAENFSKAQEDYLAASEAYRKTGQGQKPEEPLRRYDDTVRIYKKLIEKFPDYKEVDGIYYVLGYALSAQDEEKEAVKYYEAFVQRFTKSRFLPEVWTRLGEYYFDLRPRKLKEAIHAYTQALGAPDHDYFDKALYKLAWAYYLHNDFTEAVERFVQLVRYSDEQEKKGGRAGSELRGEAIQYIGLSFTEPGWGGVDKAGKYFEGKKEAYARDSLVRLADLLFDATRFPEAIAAYDLVLRRYPMHPESPRMLGCQVVAYRLLRDFSNEALLAERIPQLFGPNSAWSNENRGNKRAIREADMLAQGSILAAATFRHKQGNVYAEAGQVGKAKIEYSAAADLYRRFIEQFPTSKDVYELSYYLAETLFYAFRFEEAGAVYERVREDKEETTHQVQSGLGAFKAYENWIDAQRLKVPELPKATKDGKGIEGGPGPDTMPSYVLRLLAAGKRFLELAPQHEQAPNVAYVMAELHYKYKNFEEARARFESIVDTWQNHKVALNSARLIVDSYRLTQDWKNVEKWSRRLLAARISEGQDRRALQEELRKLKTFSLFRSAEQLQAEKKFEKAAQEFIRLADENQKADYADLALFNAGANYEEVRKYLSANRAYEKLVSRYPRSPRAEKAQFQIGENLVKIFEFDSAVNAYLRVYREYPQGENRAAALYNAAYYTENDQQYATAAGHYLRYAREFPDKEDAPASYFRAAGLYIKAKQYSRARDTFAAFITRYKSDPRFQSLIVDAQAKISDAYVAEGNRRAALREWKKTVDLFDRFTFGPGSPAAVTAARARFLEIEDEFADFQARKISGSPKRQGEILIELIKFMSRLEKDYRSLKRFKVLDWYLAALYRIGSLYQLLSQKMLDAPMPVELKTEEERNEYRTQLEDKAGVLERKATANFEIAYNEGKNQGVLNEWTQRSLEALSVLNPVKYPLMKEPRKALQVEAVSPAPIVRGAPGASIEGKGEGWKPIGK
jgi:TolA-binding protein